MACASCASDDEDSFFEDSVFFVFEDAAFVEDSVDSPISASHHLPEDLLGGVRGVRGVRGVLGAQLEYASGRERGALDRAG